VGYKDICYIKMSGRDVRNVRQELKDLKSFIQSSLRPIEDRLSECEGSDEDHSESRIKVRKDYKLIKDKIYQRLSEIEKQIDQFDERLDNLETYSRKNCIIIHGIKEEKNENVENVICDFLKSHLEVELESRDVDNCHRLGPNKSSSKFPRPIIIKLVSYLMRKKIWLKKKMLKGKGFVITESLTKKRAEIYKEAKELIYTGFHS